MLPSGQDITLVVASGLGTRHGTTAATDTDGTTLGTIHGMVGMLLITVTAFIAGTTGDGVGIIIPHGAMLGDIQVIITTILFTIIMEDIMVEGCLIALV